MTEKTKPKPVGNRTGNRGHWPAGVPRNEPTDDWPVIQAAINEILQVRDRKGRSGRALAEVLGVNERSVRRWLAGEDVPSTESCVKMRRWVKRMRKVIAT